MHTESYYAATRNDVAPYPELTGDHRVDVVIIGGGFSGISTAVDLTERGLKVVVLEAKQIGWGATGRNGGQITGSLSGDKAMAREFRKSIGSDADDFVWGLRWHGHDIIRNRVQKYGIACDLKFGQMQTAMKPSHMQELTQIYDEGQRRGMGDVLTMLDGSQMPEYLETDLYCGGLLNTKNMHVHSLNLCLGEARAAANAGALIFEQSEVTHIEHGATPRAVTQKGSVAANAVLIAGNAYHLLDQKRLGGALFPASLSIMATEPLGDMADQINPKDIAVYDSRFVLDYYRLTADKRLMFGGGTNYSGRNTTDVEAQLRPAVERTFPRLKGVKVDYSWSGIDGIIINRIPEVGRLSDNVFFVQGFSGHGIALSHILGEIMAEAITGHLERFDVFANVKHLRLPFGRRAGSLMVAVGMIYYSLLEKLR
ncbi:FAD-binding oxidoreductase [Cognatishimia sp. MH4019]|uniref:NAD(P)/FAD-dependent oxidoreductase n=1 Tax=Cognatishimia sp. MH4019 TaxID=2854030 RepID=UPI001CD44B31|nr:FAD-binding oxidoreductase [Cognatishimia sp. MH4019]